MPVLTVKQSITPEGRVQIEIANTSGLDAEHQPCSVIFSLRSSHPHFFYNRGAPSTDHNSPTSTSPTSTTPMAGSMGDNDVFTAHAIGSARALLRLSDRIWRHNNLPPLSPGPALGTKRHHSTRSNDPGDHPLSPGDTPRTASVNEAHGRSSSRGGSRQSSLTFRATSVSERPLLVKEELPDGVLLPGEARLFLIDLDDPHYISEILAKEREQQEVSRRRRRELKLAESGATVSGGGGRVVNFAPGVKGASSVDAAAAMGGPFSENSALFRSAQSAAWDEGEDANFTASGTSYRGSPPLSIIQDSTHTRESHQPLKPSGNSNGRFSFSVTTESGGSESVGSQNTYGGTHNQTLHHQRDGTEDSYDRASSGFSAGDSSKHAPKTYNSGGGGGGGWSRQQPRPTFFVLYERLGDEDKCVENARAWLKKEEKKYQAWLDKYIDFVVRLERRRRVQCGVDTGDGGGSANSSLSSRMRGSKRKSAGGDGLDSSMSSAAADGEVPLRGLRIIPPALGEGVRWRRDDGFSHYKSNANSTNVSMQAAYCASAFYYYYGFLFDGADGETLARSLATRSSSNKTLTNGVSSTSAISRSAIQLPPLFNSVHTNAGPSQMAQKMFKRSRVGGGTVIFFLKGNPQKRLRSALKAGMLDRGTGLSNRSSPHTPVPEGPYSAAIVMPSSSLPPKSATPRQSPFFAETPPPSRQLSSQAPSSRPAGDFKRQTYPSYSRDAETEEGSMSDAGGPLSMRQTTAVPAHTSNREADEQGVWYDAGEEPLSLTPRPQTHVRVRSGRGLALLEDSGDGRGAGSPGAGSKLVSSAKPSHSRDSSSGPPLDFAATRVFAGTRTNTLDPSEKADVAAMAARLPSPPPPLPPSMQQQQQSEEAASPLSYDPYPSVHLQPSLPSFSVASPLGSTGLGPAEAGSGSGGGPYRRQRNSFSPDLEGVVNGSMHSGSGGSKLLYGAGAAASPTSSARDGNSESLVNMSFAKLNEVVSYWLKRGQAAEGGDAEGGQGGDDWLLEQPEDSTAGNSSQSRSGGGRVLTAVPPSSIRATAFNRSGSATNLVGANGPAGSPPSYPYAGRGKGGVGAGGAARPSPTQVSRQLVRATAKAGNEAAMAAAEGVKLAMPVVSQAADFVVNTLLGSAVPQAAGAVSSFLTDIVLTPANVKLLMLVVMPVVVAISAVVLLWGLLHGDAGDVAESFHGHDML